MRYWNDMSSKFGFNDGEGIPQGITKYREVYILVMNALLKKHGSEIRMMAVDRGGCHNWCMIMPVRLKDVSKFKDQDFLDVTKADVNEASDLGYGFSRAFCEAIDLNVDQFIEAETRIHPDFKRVLIGIRRCPASDQKTLEHLLYLAERKQKPK